MGLTGPRTATSDTCTRYKQTTARLPGSPRAETLGGRYLVNIARPGSSGPLPSAMAACTAGGGFGVASAHGGQRQVQARADGRRIGTTLPADERPDDAAARPCRRWTR